MSNSSSHVNADNPLAIDTSTVILKIGGWVERNATGGKPPYTYSAFGATLVTIPRPHEGLVVAIHPGAPRIYVRDSEGNEVSYPMMVE